MAPSLDVSCAEPMQSTARQRGHHQTFDRCQTSSEYHPPFRGSVHDHVSHFDYRGRGRCFIGGDTRLYYLGLRDRPRSSWSRISFVLPKRTHLLTHSFRCWLFGYLHTSPTRSRPFNIYSTYYVQYHDHDQNYLTISSVRCPSAASKGPCP